MWEGFSSHTCSFYRIEQFEWNMKNVEQKENGEPPPNKLNIQRASVVFGEICRWFWGSKVRVGRLVGDHWEATESQITTGHSYGSQKKKKTLVPALCCCCFPVWTVGFKVLSFSYSHSFSYSPAAHLIRFRSQAIKCNEHLLPRVGSRASPLKSPCVAAVGFACTRLFKQTGADGAF